jgi:hypothetical protein
LEEEGVRVGRRRRRWWKGFEVGAIAIHGIVMDSERLLLVVRRVRRKNQSKRDMRDLS